MEITMFKSTRFLRRVTFVFVVITSVISTSVFVGTMMGNLLLGIAILAYALLSEKKFTSTRPLIYAFFTFFVWSSILLITGGTSSDELFRFTSYLVTGFVCLFLIPSEIRFPYFARVYTWTISIVVAVGLLTKMGLSVTILGGELATVPYSYHTYFFVGDTVSGEAIRSIFTNQNSFGPFAFFGAVLSLYLHTRYGQTRYAGLLALNFVGIYFSKSRSAMLAFLVAITIYVLYVVGWSRLVTLCSIGTIPGILAISAIGAGLLPDPLFITDVTSNRVNLWRGSVQALFDSYLLGTGLTSSADAIEPFVPEHRQGMSPHNAFLAVFVSGGLIGGTAYAFLFFYIHVMQANKLSDGFPIALVGLTVGAAFIQLFEAYLVFGFTNLSVVTALSLGYAHQFAHSRWSTEREYAETIQHETESLQD